MRPLDEIQQIDWCQFDTAYGNGADQTEYSDIAENLRQLFSEDKNTAKKASHRLWCSLCHQHTFVSSGALPAYPFLFYRLQHADEELQVELLDIFLGFAVCISKETPLGTWQSQLREKLEQDKSYFQLLARSTNEEISSFAEDIIQYL